MTGRWLAIITSALAACLSPQVAAQSGGTPSDGALPTIHAAAPDRDSASDLREFTRVAIEGEFLPKAEDLAIEAILERRDAGQGASCNLAFCLGGNSMPAEFAASPSSSHLVELELGAGRDFTSLPSEPVSIVLIIDRSGSMAGGKLAQVKAASLALLEGLRDQDRLELVAFGEDAKIAVPLRMIGSDRELFAEAIEGLAASGQTNVEAGLQLGMAQALAETARSDGPVRAILATDQRPNLDPNAAEGFVALAREGRANGVDLSFIAVRQTVDTVLALRMSSHAGARLVQLVESENGSDFMRRNLGALVAPGGNDTALKLEAGPGFAIDALFGIPPELVRAGPDGSVQIAFGPAYLAEERRSLFIAMRRDGNPADRGPLLKAALTGVEGAAEITVPSSESGRTSKSLADAHMSIDLYLSLRQALDLVHRQGDLAKARATLDALSARFADSQVGIDRRDVELVAAAQDKLASYQESPGSEILRQIAGRWEVSRQSGLAGLRKGDEVELTAARQLIITRRSGPLAGNVTRQTFQLRRGRLLVDGTDLEFEIEMNARKLDLRDVYEGDRLRLTKLD